VGTILDPGIIRLGDLMSTLLARYPWLDVELQHGISTWAMENVSNGSLDAAFFSSRYPLAYSACAHAKGHGNCSGLVSAVQAIRASENSRRSAGHLA